MSEYPLKIGDFVSTGTAVDQKFLVEGVTPTNHSSSQKTRLGDLSYGIKNLDIIFFRFVTILAFDGQTNEQTDRRTDGRTDGQTSHR